MSSRHEHDLEPEAGAAVVRAARESARLSQRELAARMGVSPATVAEVERGHDARRSTLLRLLAALPGLDARRLLLGPGTVGSLGAAACWRFLESCAGFTTARVEVAARRRADGGTETTTTIAGVRSLGGDLDDPRVLLPLARAVFRGPASLLRDALPERLGSETSVACVDGMTEHVLDFPRGWRHDGFTCRRTETSVPAARAPGDDEAVMHALGHPAASLVLAAEDHGEGPAAWVHAPRPSGLGPSEDDPITALERRVDGAGSAARVSIAHPLPHVAHALSRRRARVPAATIAARGEDLASVVRNAREESGLSLRALAALMGTGVATAAGIERAIDPRASTLRALLDALPCLCPDDLLPDPPGACEATSSDCWERQRALAGVEVDRELKRVTVDAAGGARVEHVSSGLRRVVPSAAPLVVRHASHPLAEGAPARPASIRRLDPGAEDDVRTRLTRMADGRLLHLLTFPADAAASGITCERAVELTSAFATSASDPRARRDPDGSAWDGTTLAVGLPARRLAVEVRFPPDLRVDAVRALVWPPLLVPADAEALAARLHGGPLAARLEGRSAWLEVERPLVGFRYSLSWRLRD